MKSPIMIQPAKSMDGLQQLVGEKRRPLCPRLLYDDSLLSAGQSCRELALILSLLVQTSHFRYLKVHLLSFFCSQ